MSDRINLAELRHRIKHGYFGFHGGSSNPDDQDDEAMLRALVEAVEAAHGSTGADTADVYFTDAAGTTHELHDWLAARFEFDTKETA